MPLCTLGTCGFRASMETHCHPKQKVVDFVELIVFAGSSPPISLVLPRLASATVISSPELETQPGAFISGTALCPQRRDLARRGGRRSHLAEDPQLDSVSTANI